MQYFNVTFKPDGRQISVHAGATLLEAAGQAGIILNSVCGGKGICQKCAVTLEEGAKHVLACQYHVESDLTVIIPAESRLFEQRILTDSVDAEIRIEPDIYKKYLKSACGDAIFGVAVDIGTTTVVAKLIDMSTGRCAGTEATINPQRKYGDDVISRISYAQTAAKLVELHKTIIDCINKLVEQLCGHSSVNPERIYEMCVVGNTTMNHIFLKLPVKQLGQAPYEAFSLDAYDRRADELGLRINPGGNVHTVENIAGFVGADTTGVALAVDVNSAREMTLVIDIGTNGEVILGTADKLYAASCAAGPALEGARIKHGSAAVAGAIEAVIVNKNDIDVQVIGEGIPRSICGSGLIDAVAVLLELGIVDASGRFVERKELPGSLPGLISSRIAEHDGQPAFILAHNPNSPRQKVILTQRDIREMQLAKAAIRTGIQVLQKKIGVEDCGIRRILLAGAFGNYIRRESALRIGLLPDVAAERIQFVGNAASAGAQMALISTKARELAGQLARKIQYIEIAKEAEFQDIFAESILF